MRVNICMFFGAKMDQPYQASLQSCLYMAQRKTSRLSTLQGDFGTLEGNLSSMHGRCRQKRAMGNFVLCFGVGQLLVHS